MDDRRDLAFMKQINKRINRRTRVPRAGSGAGSGHDSGTPIQAPKITRRNRDSA